MYLLIGVAIGLAILLVVFVGLPLLQSQQHCCLGNPVGPDIGR
jgi:hypothetical protein